MSTEHVYISIDINIKNLREERDLGTENNRRLHGVTSAVETASRDNEACPKREIS